MNIVEHVSLWHSRESFRYMPQRNRPGPSGRTIFNFLRNCLIDFQSCCTSLVLCRLNSLEKRSARRDEAGVSRWVCEYLLRGKRQRMMGLGFVKVRMGRGTFGV